MKDLEIEKAIELWDPILATKALADIEELLKHTGVADDRVYLLFSKAQCFAILGDFERAREFISLALGEQPNDADTQLSAQYHQALFTEREGKQSQALQEFDTILKTYPELSERLETRFIFEELQQHRAFLLFHLFRFEEAASLFKDVLRFELEKDIRSDALAASGVCHLELEQWDQAKDRLLEAKAAGITKKWEGKFHFYLGIAYYYTDLYREAKSEFKLCEERAIQYQLPTLDIYRWLAAISKALGETIETERYARLMRPV